LPALAFLVSAFGLSSIKSSFTPLPLFFGDRLLSYTSFPLVGFVYYKDYFLAEFLVALVVRSSVFSVTFGVAVFLDGIEWRVNVGVAVSRWDLIE
jgi:hypothetical protein